MTAKTAFFDIKQKMMQNGIEINSNRFLFVLTSPFIYYIIDVSASLYIYFRGEPRFS